MIIWSLGLILISDLTVAKTCLPPKTQEFEVESTTERSSTGFTQGLEFHDGVLYESTGAYQDTTRLNKIDANGVVTTIKDFGSEFFGEGLTILNDKVYQLTWKDRKVFVHDLKASPPTVSMQSYNREGWGLTNDGERLISSDGSSQLAFHDPKNINNFTFLNIRDEHGPVSKLNELEFANGKIYANTHGGTEVLRIDPKTGCVDARIELQNLMNQMSPAQKQMILADRNFVLNGIAFDEKSDTFFMTGKKWPLIFKGKIEDSKPKKGTEGGESHCQPHQTTCTNKSSTKR